MLQPVPAGEGEGAVTETTPPTPGTRPGEDMDYSEDTEKMPDDDEDLVCVDLTNHLPLSTLAMCPYRIFHVRELNFLITTQIFCKECNVTLVRKIPDTNKFLFNYNVRYRSKLLSDLINSQ